MSPFYCAEISQETIPDSFLERRTDCCRYCRSLASVIAHPMTRPPVFRKESSAFRCPESQIDLADVIEGSIYFPFVCPILLRLTPQVTVFRMIAPFQETCPPAL